VAGSVGPSHGAGLRVFVSHTSELREFPAGVSYVAAVERAISACGHVIVDMADFPAADQVPAELCAERVRDCDVYVGVLGTRYGSPVRDRSQVSYTELEFETATDAGLDRLVFLLDTGAADVGIPLSGLIDLDFGARQEAFRRRVQDRGLVTGSFANPDMLGQLVERSLRELAAKRPGLQPLEHPRRVWNIPARNPGFGPPRRVWRLLWLRTTSEFTRCQCFIVDFLVHFRWHIPAVRVNPHLVIPLHPVRRGDHHITGPLPASAEVDKFSFIQAVQRFRRGVIV